VETLLASQTLAVDACRSSSAMRLRGVRQAPVLVRLARTLGKRPETPRDILVARVRSKFTDVTRARLRVESAETR
jgi:hypothetical protein